jgi:hypothetical protein
MDFAIIRVAPRLIKRSSKSVPILKGPTIECSIISRYSMGEVSNMLPYYGGAGRNGKLSWLKG